MTKVMSIRCDIEIEPCKAKFAKGVLNENGKVVFHFDDYGYITTEIITGEQFLDLDRKEQYLYTLVTGDYLFRRTCVDKLYAIDRSSLLDVDEKDWLTAHERVELFRPRSHRNRELRWTLDREALEVNEDGNF